MTEQPDDATRRVVKKVVKKTVVRPVSPTTRSSVPAATQPATATAGPRQRTARLTTPARAQASRAATAPAPTSSPTVTVAPTTVKTSPKRAPAAAQPPVARASQARRRPSLPSLPSLPKPDIRGHVADLGHGIRDRFSDGVEAVRNRVMDGWDWLIGLRLPHLSPVRGSVITGVLVGLLSVTIGWGFYQLFSATLGTQAGGGWGFLAFVSLSFVAFISGELLLSGFGVPHARVVSMLSVLLVLLLVLVFFIKLAAGIWAWPLIPALCAACFAASNTIMSVATKEENPQRLPWEPTDQSQVRID